MTTKLQFEITDRKISSTAYVMFYELVDLD